VKFCYQRGKNFTDISIAYPSIRGGWGKVLLDKKKGTDESVKDQGYVGCVFLL
jgi:hypothetical protein